MSSGVSESREKMPQKILPYRHEAKEQLANGIMFYTSLAAGLCQVVFVESGGLRLTC